MKKVVMIRHGKKDGELIAPEQITEIEQNGIRGLNELVQESASVAITLGSGLERTRQTILAYSFYMEKNCIFPSKILQADVRFGTKTLFSRMTGNAELMAAKSKMGWYDAMVFVEPLLLDTIQEHSYNALESIFDVAGDDELVIIIGHSPLIEFLAFKLGAEDKIDRVQGLKELQGITFLQNGSQEITVGDIIG